MRRGGDTEIQPSSLCSILPPRKGKGIGSHREHVRWGEGRSICTCCCPGQTTVVDRMEQGQERSSERADRAALSLSCPTKGDNRSVHTEISIILYARHMPTSLPLNFMLFIPFFSFLAAPYSRWGLSSPTRDQTVLCIEAWS